MRVSKKGPKDIDWDEVATLAERVSVLAQDPHPGLFTWMEAMESAFDALVDAMAVDETPQLEDGVKADDTSERHARRDVVEAAERLERAVNDYQSNHGYAEVRAFMDAGQMIREPTPWRVRVEFTPVPEPGE